MKSRGLILIAAALLGAAAAHAAQPADSLLIHGGWEVGVQGARYRYEEPATSTFGGMNLKGNRGGAVAAYTFAGIDRVYSRIDGRVSYGRLKYASGGTGTADDIPDWIAEARAVIGRDFLPGGAVALSPYLGLGYRYLYNDLRGYTSTGNIGYRRYSHYVYAPVGLTVRLGVGNNWVVAPTIEYDVFLGGRQYSKLSDVNPGASDASNDQNHGRGYRASLMFENRHWAFGPWLHYWKIRDSDVVPIAPGIGFFEPTNWTREYGVEIRYRF